MKRVLEIAVPLIVVALIGWASWLTTGVFSGDKNQAVQEEKVNSLCGKVEEIKTEVKEIRSEMKQDKKEVEQKREEMMKLLYDIKREVKK